MDKTILFVSMPWASAKRPLLGIGVLQGKLKQLGYSAKAIYLNVTFSKLFGLKNYEFFADNPSLYPMAEFLFAANLFEYEQDVYNKYLKSFFGDDYLEQNSYIIDSISNLRETIIPEFVNDSVNRILKFDTDIVGFTSTFNQIFPSLTVAKKIKKKMPEKITILGGACFHDEMGVEYSRVFGDYIDYVFTGEADNSLPKFMDFLNGRAELQDVDGIARKGIISKESLPISNMEDVGIPDYHDYFKEIQRIYQESGISILEGIPYESSRGCWWGEKKHCSFCGLNNMGMAYRSKEDNRVINELSLLSSEYKTTHFLAADNILNNSAYKGLLKKMANLPFNLNLFYEIKSNTHRDNVQALSQAGIKWVQPGIESFSTNVLRIMRKGVSMLQNVQFLKFAKEYEVKASYNILIGFKGETPEDYSLMISVIKKIKHLPSPSGLATEVQIHRFSPMHYSPELFGFANVRPCNYYNHWFPTNFADLEKIAYFFDGDQVHQNNDSKQLLNQYIQNWIDSTLDIYSEIGPNFIQIIYSEKYLIIKKEILDEIDSIIYVLTDEIRSVKFIEKFFEFQINSDEIELRIRNLEKKNIILGEKEKYLNLIPFQTPMNSKKLSTWLEIAKKNIGSSTFVEIKKHNIS